MSFLKDLAKEFKDLKASLSGDEKKKDEHGAGAGGEGERAYDPNYGAPAHQPAPYGGYPGPEQQQHGYPPQPQGPPLPPGWVAQFDESSGRWYYIEQATGISRWEPPAHTAPYGQYPPPQVPQYAGYPAGGPGQDPYAHGQPGYGGYPGQGPPGDYSQGGYYGGERSGENKDKGKDDKKNMMLAAGGGLAAGALGGALIANAMDDSDDEAKAAAAGTAPPASAPPPVGLPPDETADGDSVSASDRESVLEARQEYEEAQLAAQDSDASSSEQEELEEAREEYEEEYEETYDD